MKLKPLTPHRFRRRVFGQLWMLALQFVLGMLLNLIGSDASGFKHNAYDTVLVIHILNAIGLLEGSIYIALKMPSKLAWWAAALITIALSSGILTWHTGNDIWSFVMAVGFLTSSWQYVLLYVRADRSVHSE